MCAPKGNDKSRARATVDGNGLFLFTTRTLRRSARGQSGETLPNRATTSSARLARLEQTNRASVCCAFHIVRKRRRVCGETDCCLCVFSRPLGVIEYNRHAVRRYVAVVCSRQRYDWTIAYHHTGKSQKEMTSRALYQTPCALCARTVARKGAKPVRHKAKKGEMNAKSRRPPCPLRPHGRQS